MERNNTRIPRVLTDVALHTKDKNGVEHLILPLGRYGNLLNAPRLVYDFTSGHGAPYNLYVQNVEELSSEDLRELIPEWTD